jgi:RNA methyltransferase, TrmH family
MLHDHNSGSFAAPHVLCRVRSLIHSRSARDSTRQFWIEGIRQFVHASDARFEFDTLIHSPILLRSSLTQKLVRRLVASGVRRVTVTPEQFRSFSIADRASGIGAIVRQRWVPLRGASAVRGLGWLAVARLRSPGNLGTILRTAEATGMCGVMFVGDASDPYDPSVLRAAMGGTFHLRLVRTYPDALHAWMLENEVCGIGLSPRAEQPWTEVPRDRPLMILLGEERHGLSDPLQRLCDVHVRLPMTGRADSLNVAVAAGVMMYELVRRGLHGPPHTR